MGAAPASPGWRARVRVLYESDAPWARRSRDVLLTFDLAVLLFVIVTSFLPPSPWVAHVDRVLGVALLGEFAARILSSPTPRQDLLHPWTLLDAVAIASFLVPLAGEPLGFLRALRLVRVLRLFHVLDRLREASPWFRRNEEAVLAATNLVVFIFVMTGLVYATQHRSNPQIRDYADALYFTITVFSTVGFGDITAKTELARILVSIQMMFDLAVFGLVAKLIFGAVEVALKKKAPVPAPGGQPDAPETA